MHNPEMPFCHNLTNGRCGVIIVFFFLSEQKHVHRNRRTHLSQLTNGRYSIIIIFKKGTKEHSQKQTYTFVTIHKRSICHNNKNVNKRTSTEIGEYMIVYTNVCGVWDFLNWKLQCSRPLPDLRVNLHAFSVSEITTLEVCVCVCVCVFLLFTITNM